MTKTCRTCRHAEWQRGKQGGVRKSVSGRCTVSDREIQSLLDHVNLQLPICIEQMRTIRRFGIWWDKSEECPMHEQARKAGGGDE